MAKFAIMVWRFKDAPKEYQALSPHGGDEDWVAFFPEEYGIDEYVGWADGGSFGCCDVSCHEVVGGHIRIGAHA